MSLDVLAPVRASRAVLLDFDGPVCSAFAGHPATEVAEALRSAAADQGVPVSHALRAEHDPMRVLRGLWEADPENHPASEALLTAFEVESVAAAAPTPGAVAFLRACTQTSRPLAVVSNNSPESVRAFLDKHDLEGLVRVVIGRDKTSPTLMKPHPHLPLLALEELGADPAGAILVGDSATDIEAAHAVGAYAVGYANRPGKREQFEALGADVVVEDMEALAGALTG